MKIINFQKKKMKLLTKEQQESYANANVIFAKKKLKIKVQNHCDYTGEYRGAQHNICNLKYSVLKKIPIAFHNGSNYDYHKQAFIYQSYDYIINKLTEKL